MTAASDWREKIAERTEEWVNLHQGRPGYDIVPPHIVEGIINVESGGDPNAYNAGSGAAGLGQITEGGLEWGAYLRDHPDAKFSSVSDPDVNIDVMIAGLSARHASGVTDRLQGGNGAQQDWYMTAAGYLGGADNDGFNGASDSLGTSGPEYVRRVRLYIMRTWGTDTASEIDSLEPGAAKARGGDWQEGGIFYDPTAKAASKHKDLLDKILGGFSDGLSGAVDGAKDAVSGALDGLWEGITGAAPRFGIGLLGIVIVGLGVFVVLRGQIAKSTGVG